MSESKKRQLAKNAVDTAIHCLFEANVLLDAAGTIAHQKPIGQAEKARATYDNDELDLQVSVLNGIANECVKDALESINAVDDYFQAKPAAKKPLESKTQPVRQELNASAAVAGKIQ